jgi:hypothetical protein
MTDAHIPRHHHPTRIFKGAQILGWIARGSENVRAHNPRDYVYIGDDPSELGDSWIFTTGEKDQYDNEKLWRFDLPFTEEPDPEKEYLCPQVIAFEGKTTDYDDMDGWGDAVHVRRCDHCSIHKQENLLTVELKCGSCRDR